MKNMKVSMKLLVSFIIIIALAVTVGVTGVIGLNSMSNEAESMYTNMAIPLSDLAQASEFFQRVRVQIRNAILYVGDDERLEKVESDLDARLASFESLMTEYGPTIATQAGRDLYAATMEEYNNVLKPGLDEMMDEAKSGMHQEELLESMVDLGTAADSIATNMRELTSLRLTVMSNANDRTTSTFNTLFMVIVAVIAVAVVVAVILALYISSLISKPLKDMMGYIKQAGETGNLSYRDEEWANCDRIAQMKDEIGQTMKAFTTMMRKFVYYGELVNQVAEKDLTITVQTLGDQDTIGNALKSMVTDLSNMFEDIKSSTSQVATGSTQIADGAQALAQGSTEQAATVQQLSAAISDISTKTHDNAVMAGNAAKLANEIMNNAEKGSMQMDEMTSAVNEINQASQDISKVIKVIDDIAFQTNILALNAAVEAARAGQHGKGFAVVADEVRSLAAKSAEAAKDTGTLIANSIAKAELGARIATDTAASLSEIVNGINESNEIVGHIASSSDEQNLAISQINEGIDQVAQVVQQNSATAEQSAASAQELSGQSAMLAQLVSQFRLKDQYVMSSSKGSLSVAQNQPASSRYPDSTGFAMKSGADKY